MSIWSEAAAVSVICLVCWLIVLERRMQKAEAALYLYDLEKNDETVANRVHKLPDAILTKLLERRAADANAVSDTKKS